jgi:hypothetical protein
MSIILQANFTPSPEQERQSGDALVETAEQIAKGVGGLQWKVWISSSKDRLRGGIYFFDDIESARAWGEGSLRELLAAGGGTDIALTYFDVDEKLSAITRAPIRRVVEA